jgi:putative transposase
LTGDRDTEFTQVFDALLTGEGHRDRDHRCRVPPVNSIMARWIPTRRRELLDRTLIWDQAHLLNALGEFESFCNEHRPYCVLHAAAPVSKRGRRQGLHLVLGDQAHLNRIAHDVPRSVP